MIENYVLSAIFLPVLLFLGIVTSWEDVKSGKIRNKWIKFGLYYAIIALGSLAIWNIIAQPVTQYYYNTFTDIGINDPRPVFTVYNDYFSRLAINSSLVLIVGFFLWRYGMLAAGDAKLLFIFSLFIPLNYYWKTYLPVFPSLALLINVFLPSLIFILLVSIYHSFRLGISKYQEGIKIKPKELLGAFVEKLPDIAKVFVGFLVILILMDHFRTFARPVLVIILPDESFVFLIIFLLYRPLFKFFNKYKIVPYISIIFLLIYFAIAFYLDPAAASTRFKRMFTMVVIFISLFKTIAFFLAIYFNKVAEEKVPLKELRAGMSLAEEVDSVKGSIVGGGLSEVQVREVRTWAKENDVKDVKIFRKFPFALWIFLGVLITLIIKGSILKFVIPN